MLQNTPQVVKNLIILNVLMYLGSGLIGDSVAVPLLAGTYPGSPFFQPWQIITHMFMHGDLGHIFFNMFALFMFGSQLERVWGPQRFLTYYMACGWHRGYFGMQVNSPEERRIIFSVWDRGEEPTDPNRVADVDRVRLVNKGDGVFTGRFGNEGTGGHSHLKYPWKTGSNQKFLVTAEPTDATHTRFSGFYFHPDSQKWMLISSWDTPGEGGYLKGLYSFSENFGGVRDISCARPFMAISGSFGTRTPGRH